MSARKRKVVSNNKRCPFLTIIEKHTDPKTGTKTITEEFNDCYKEFCMAYNKDKGTCKFIDEEEEF